MANKEVLVDGEDINFDLINDQNLRLLNPERASLLDSPKKIPGQSSKLTPETEIQVLSVYSKSVNSNILKETPKEKLNRLKGELSELNKELILLVDKDRNIKFAAHETEMKILQEIAEVQEQLSMIYLNDAYKKALDSDTLENISSDEHILALKKNIDYHHSEVALAKLKEAINKDQSTKINFKLNIQKDPEGAPNQEKFTALEALISECESTIGTSERNNILLQAKKIRKRVEAALTAKLASSDYANKISEFNTLLNELNAEKRKKDVSDPNIAFVDKLYDGFNKLQSNSQVLGTINDRLECVKMIHEENSEIGTSMKTIHNNKVVIDKEISDNRQLLDKVENNLQSNIQDIMQSLKSLQTRAEGLSKKK